jgi:hypothetical protein
LDSTLKKIEERITSIEKININRSPLDSILKKIKERIASMNTKLIKVDELNINIANISLLVARLI